PHVLKHWVMERDGRGGGGASLAVARDEPEGVRTVGNGVSRQELSYAELRVRRQGQSGLRKCPRPAFPAIFLLDEILAAVGIPGEQDETVANFDESEIWALVTT